MNQTAIELLEYQKIKEDIMEYAISEEGKAQIKNLCPSIDINIIEGWLNETTEARAVIDKSASIPLHNLEGTSKILGKLGKGMPLLPEELTIIARLLKDVGKMIRFMDDKKNIAPRISSYILSTHPLEDLMSEIQRCIENGRICDQSSAGLLKIRKKIATIEERIKSKLDSILKSSAYRECLQDNLVSIKDGRYVIPIKNEYRKNIEGTIVGSSATGSTVFIQPMAVKKLQDELYELKAEEEKEEYKILYFLTGLVETYQQELSIDIETMIHYDFLFAKAKYSKVIGGMTVSFNTDNYIDIQGGKHPLIGKAAVPLYFTIGKGYKALAVTGPNTGGKTVVLKTVGLLTMMAQSGLHVPVEKESELAVFVDILADIGDGQSIQQSLSTFSSHIRNIISIMECAGPHTLVILDELGAGTDPGEGMGLAIAVLEEIYRKGSTIIATTHYSEIKSFADESEGFENGCMEFDIQTLKPLYRLTIGKAGQSNAFLIALRLGMDLNIIQRAHEVTYYEKKDYTYIVADMKKENLKNIEVIQSHGEQLRQHQEREHIRKTAANQKKQYTFKIGDCVFVSSMNRRGIVCEVENSRGEIGIMIEKKKFRVNRKRLSLYIDGKELYPEDYDMDTIFESKENRKKRKLISRKYVKDVEIEI
ncbi:hypothetical protein [Petroclostridium sp. X23]|uniref:endonuclease MutS2 n=1 Tax=Petroclostridium sp. X23 TaxID=3045146 RepID=UPI0024AE3B0F|nr:hypothetical protein [Petroclostridium sp. X23]WHH57232.1 hypothetical protein QKW49_15450 [Petroclostridium sp. X23]